MSSWLNGGLFGAAPFEFSTTGSQSVATHGVYTSVTFTGSGSLTVTAGARIADVLLVAGGGGGDSGGSSSGGG
ncbi:MAG: hypothetical protein V3R81_14435, partial [Gammaproteobacteria bacterium]